MELVIDNDTSFVNFANPENTIKNEELQRNSSLYFLFQISEGIRIKEIGYGYFKPVTDFLNGSDTRVFALIVND